MESVPGRVSGAWVFKNTRTPVAVVFENLEDGMTIDEVMEQFPVTREQVTRKIVAHWRISHVALVGFVVGAHRLRRSGPRG